MDYKQDHGIEYKAYGIDILETKTNHKKVIKIHRSEKFNKYALVHYDNATIFALRSLQQKYKNN